MKAHPFLGAGYAAGDGLEGPPDVARGHVLRVLRLGGLAGEVAGVEGYRRRADGAPLLERPALRLRRLADLVRALAEELAQQLVRRALRLAVRTAARARAALLRAVLLLPVLLRGVFHCVRVVRIFRLILGSGEFAGGIGPKYRCSWMSSIIEGNFILM